MTTLGRWNRSITDASGNIRNASVAVYKESDGLLATIYSDRSGATPKSNPFTLSNSDYGLAFFHAAGGAYKVVATDGSWSQTWRYEPVGTGAEFDADSLAGVTPPTTTVAALLRLAEGTNNGTNYVQVTVPASMAANYTFTLPAADVTMSTYAGTLLAAASASNARTTLGLGTSATVDTGTSGTKVALLDGANTWTATQTFTPPTNTGGMAVVHAWANNNSSGLDIKKRGTTGDANAAVVSGAEIGYHSFFAWDGSSYQRSSYVIVKAAENISSGAYGATYSVFIVTPGTSTSLERVRIGQGISHPSATGGDKGNNTINFGAVYDDNSLLTCMAMSKEFLESGEVDLDKWDALVPDQIVPEHREERPLTYKVQVTSMESVDEPDEMGRIVRRTMRTSKVVDMPAVIADPVYDEAGQIVDAIETALTEEVVIPERVVIREHRTARVFKAMLDGGFDPREPEQYFARMRADEALPGMPTRASWKHNGLCIGEQFSHQWLAMEMLAIVTNVIWARLKDVEVRVSQLEGGQPKIEASA